MYALWLLIYFAFFPAAYLGWIGLFGQTAKKAADDYFHMIWLALVGLVIIIALDVVLRFLQALIVTIVGT